jgi:hypothetical protein
MRVFTEPFRADRDHDLDLPKTRDAESRRLHDARLGRSAYLRRIASARSRPRVPSSGRTAKADLARADVLLCAHLVVLFKQQHNHDDVIVNVINDTAPTTPDARVGAPNIARALALGAAKRVEFLVAATAEKPGLDAVSSDRKGDGAMVEAVRRRGQVRNPNARRWIVARIVILFFLIFFSLSKTTT